MSQRHNGTTRRADVAAEVAVVGAGPAGAAAAITLAHAGRDCVLIDKASFPRDKCCGDGLTIAALRHLDALGLDPLRVPSFRTVDELSFRAPTGRVARVPLPRRPGVFGAVAERRELDSALLESALGAGARTLLGDAVTEVDTAGESGVRLVLDSGATVSAHSVVAADGAWSPLRRALAGGGAARPLARPASPAGAGGAPAARRSPRSGASEFFAFRAYASSVGPEAASELWVWFEASLLPGYAWSFPLAGGRANVGIYLRRSPERRGHELAAAWEQVIERPFVRSLLGPSAELEPVRSWPIPARVVRSELLAAGGRVLFAGDAAGVADPFTGEGIAQALESGIAAAEAIAGARTGDPGAAGASYQARVSRTIARDQAVARWCSSLMSRRAGALAAVALSDATDLTRRSSARWLFEDYPRGAPLRPRDWLARRPPEGPFSSLRLSSLPGWAPGPPVQGSLRGGARSR